jgi:hypothetical protein
MWQGAATSTIVTSLNTDYTNCGGQSLYATDTTVGADRGTAGGMIPRNYVGTANRFTKFDMLLFSKSGFIRPAITSVVRDIGGTTVSLLNIAGQSWNNTADNITSIELTAGANQILAGSQFDLYALYTS